MKKLTKTNINDIERQMFNKARDIDVALYNYTLDEMPREFVYTALTMYQNKDGGWGHGLDNDNLNPNSTVYQSFIALNTLAYCGYESYKEDEDLENMLNKTFNYLYNRNPNWNVFEVGNLNFACAERFRNPSSSNFLKSSICGLTIYFLDEKKAYYKKALSMLDSLDTELLSKEELSYDEILGYKLLFLSLAKKGIEYNEEAYFYYLKLRNQYISKLEVSSINYEQIPNILDDDSEFTDKLNLSLDIMIDERKSHGLWEATHEWGNLYPEGESAKLKWLGAKTWENISLLKKYGRIEE